MKALYLLASDGGFKRASSSQIADVLDGRTQSTIARLSVSDEGDATPVALNEAELAELRNGLTERRDAELALGLDRFLEALRRLDPITGVGLYSSHVSIDLGEAPWAEQAVRNWAAINGLAIRDENPPTSVERWTRNAWVNLGRESWSRTVVVLNWPTVSVVARDAELDGRTEDAAAINAEAF